jgi:hypothetical protein
LFLLFPPFFSLLLLLLLFSLCTSVVLFFFFSLLLVLLFPDKPDKPAGPTTNKPTGEVTWYRAINQFSDVTEAEFRGSHGWVSSRGLEAKGALSFVEDPDFHVPAGFDLSTLPKGVDWRTKGVVSPIKNQGMCGECFHSAILCLLSFALLPLGPASSCACVCLLAPAIAPSLVFVSFCFLRRTV